jgi:hypothetical protein
MSAQKLLNEKTLELNLTHEILEICRQFDQQAFAFGTTLRQESHWGYDSRILGNIPQFWRGSVFQFKKALRSRRTQTGESVFVFQINNNTFRDQHRILHRFTGGKRDVSFYVLPTLTTLKELNIFLPDLLNRTFFVDVASISPAAVRNEIHEIHLYPQTSMGILFSDETKEIEVLSSDRFKMLLLEKAIGLPISVLLENIKRIPREDERTSSTKPRFVFNIFTK